MNNLSLAHRLKARLARTDRLANATALLQRMLAHRTASETRSALAAHLAPLFGLPRRRSGQASPKRLSTGPTERLSPRYPMRFATSWTASDKAAPHRVCPPA